MSEAFSEKSEAFSEKIALGAKDLRQAIALLLMTFAMVFSSLMLVWTLYWQKHFGLDCIEVIRSAIVLTAMLFTLSSNKRKSELLSTTQWLDRYHFAIFTFLIS
jgi:hypothetical protein